MDYFQKALHTFNGGNWYSWKTHDDNGNKISNDQRMSYENIIVHDSSITKPTESEVNAKIQELKNAETQKANDKISAQNKLKALGLTDAEIEAL